MTGQITPELRVELQRIWDALLRHARWRGIPFQDAEDLVSNSLRSALEHFDSARGALAPYCRTILVNAIRNYWRDRKVDLPLEADIEDRANEGPDLILEEKESVEAMKRTIEQLSKALSPDELAFMKMLGKVVDELGERAVSETARRLGLKPEKGWDLFRRIQRKAHALEVPPLLVSQRRTKPSTASEAAGAFEPAPKASAPGISADRVKDDRHIVSLAMLDFAIVPESETLFAIAGAMARKEGFEKFLLNV